jgi:hypothetical protein
MRIFEEAISRTTRSCVIESAVGVALTIGIMAVWGVQSLGLQVIDPHPVWLVVLVIAARYGTRGLAVALPIAWGALAVLAGQGGFGRVLDTLAAPMELSALAAAVLVAWIASGNERRERALTAKSGDLERRATADAATIAELRRAALALRARTDRLDLSLTFLRNIARRLHGTDAEAAGQAALELIAARIGARAASIEMMSAGELRQLATVGIWNRDGQDRTALAAFGGRQPTRAVELADGGPGDSDIAAPIIDPSGQVRGIIAARGVPGGGSSMAALRDLAVITEWASPALCARTQPSGGAGMDDDDRPDDEPDDPDEDQTDSLTISNANV